MLRLTPSQERRLSTFETRSFEQMCIRRGYDPGERAAAILQAAQSELRILRSAVQRETSDSIADFDEATQHYLQAQDLWSFKRHQTFEVVGNLGAHIDASNHVLPIDWVYLDVLAREIGISPPQPTLQDGITRFLRELPHLRLYDNEFNAFVERGSLLDNIPCVCVYECLTTGSQRLIDVAVGKLIPPGLPLTMIGADAARIVGAQQETQRALHQVLEMILGHSDTATFLESDLVTRTRPDLVLPARIMAAGAHDFTWLHEYGHLLLGHLRHDASHELEYAADAFAFAAIQRTPHVPDGSKLWYMLGALALLTIIVVLEAATVTPLSETHPSGRQRLGNLLNQIPEAHRVELLVPQFILLTLIEPLLRERYDVPFTAA